MARPERPGTLTGLAVMGALGMVGFAASPVGAAERQAARAARVFLVSDAVGDPGLPSGAAADSPTESSGPFDASRSDLGADDDLGSQRSRGRRLPPGQPSPADLLPDPLATTPRIDPATTGADAERELATMLPPRTDAAHDWVAPLEPLHHCHEPRALPPCIPPPPCHPTLPPDPFDLVGVAGTPSSGPIYRGPCAPRSATLHAGPLGWLHTLTDRLFDAFYTPR